MAGGDSATLGLKGLNGTSVSLQLLNGSGQLLSAGGTAQNLDGVITNFVAASAGTDYPLVPGGVRGGFNLALTRDPGLDTELNDVKTSAPDIPSKETARHQR